MNVLVTGASGYVGRALVKSLLADGINVFAIIRKNTDKRLLNHGLAGLHVDNGDDNQLLKFVKGSNCEGVIHLASYFTVSHNTCELYDLINSNVLFSTRIIDISCNHGISWFLNIGTFWEHLDCSDYFPVNLYAATKKAFENISRYYIEQFNLKYLTLKINDTYGPGDKRNKIINLWFNTIKNGASLKMSPGDQLIDIVYIDDVVDALRIAMKRLCNDGIERKKCETYRISAIEKYSLKELSKLFEESVGRKLKIEWGALPYRSNEVMNPSCPFKIVPGWTPKISIKKGLSMLSQEYLDSKKS